MHACWTQFEGPPYLMQAGAAWLHPWLVIAKEGPEMLCEELPVRMLGLALPTRPLNDV